jgi:uncharacterized protein
MTITHTLNAGKNITPQSGATRQPGRSFAFKGIFVGPHGIRAGWRLLLFAILIVIFLATGLLIRNGGVEGFREAHRHAAQITVTPTLMIVAETVAFVGVFAATWIMAKIERRKFSTYGLPWSLALHKDFWVGTLCGFGALSGSLLAMFFLHGFRITGLALHGGALISAPAAWAVAFLLTGLNEEFLLRGYFQYTLADSIGFWPAAFVLSGLFAVGHAFNANETLAGVLSVIGFGLILCLLLRRTGNLWCAIGFHAAYDWGQTLYGVPDSGMLPYHSVFHSAFNGRTWLTGGVVGPEGSMLTPIALLVTAMIFSFFYRENRYQKAE